MLDKINNILFQPETPMFVSENPDVNIKNKKIVDSQCSETVKTTSLNLESVPENYPNAHLFVSEFFFQTKNLLHSVIAFSLYCAYIKSFVIV